MNIQRYEIQSFPWILNNQEKNTAYAGIGYSVKRIGDHSEIVIGCSHIYDSNGQGLKYKLSKIDNYFLHKKMNPYLSFKDVFQFGVSIRELLYQTLDKLPERVVIHKRTNFTEDEINGIRSSLNKAGIKKVDLIWFENFLFKKNSAMLKSPNSRLLRSLPGLLRQSYKPTKP